MKKTVASLLLCFCAMRLAVAAGAEEGIRDMMSYLERRSGLSGAVDYRETEQSESAAVGNDYTSELAIIDESGEIALNLGEKAGPGILSSTFSGELSIRNDSSRNFDAAELMSKGPGTVLPAAGPQILIIHTHGSEAYTQSPEDRYMESDPYRTVDKSKNVVKVGDVLTEVLESKGLRVLHDREIYDYPSYTGSYSRSGNAVEEYLKKYPDIAVVIDLHRDALGTGDKVYKTKAEPGLGECAQVMLLVGTGENGLYHPLWEENLRLALYLQNAMEQAYPGLARPLSVKSERYNQHLSPGAMIIEVGSSGNTLSEALRAIELFGDAAGDALKNLAESE